MPAKIKKRQQKSTEARRNDILHSAEKLFVANGVSDTRIEDIAKDANIGKGTVYLYFKNKDDILQGLGASFISYFVERLAFHRQQCHHNDLPTLLDAWIMGCLDAFYDKVDLHELVFHKSSKHPIEHRHDNPAVNLLEQLLIQHQQPDPALLASMMFNSVHGAIDYAFANPPVIEKTAMFDKVAPLLRRLLD